MSGHPVHAIDPNYKLDDKRISLGSDKDSRRKNFLQPIEKCGGLLDSVSSAASQPLPSLSPAYITRRNQLEPHYSQQPDDESSVYESLTLVNWHEEVLMKTAAEYRVDSSPVEESCSLADCTLDLDPPSSIAEHPFHPPLSEDNKLLKDKLSSHFGSVVTASRDILWPESIVQEIWDTVLTDPYCLDMDPLASISPLGTTESIGVRNMEDITQSFSGLGSSN
ncbi:hypothetical protein FRC19_009671, partial [Serendipita sp. 401]